MPYLLRTLAVVCLLIAPAAAQESPPAKTPAKRPNVLIFLADDSGFSDTGCYGGEIKTPNIDRLAADGLRFTQFYNTARCWPTRACLMTGYYAQQIRMDPPSGRLPPWARLLPQYLKPQGYRCYHSGKWHVTGRRGPWPTAASTTPTSSRIRTGISTRERTSRMTRCCRR